MCSPTVSLFRVIVWLGIQGDMVNSTLLICGKERVFSNALGYPFWCGFGHVHPRTTSGIIPNYHQSMAWCSLLVHDHECMIGIN